MAHTSLRFVSNFQRSERTGIVDRQLLQGYVFGRGNIIEIQPMRILLCFESWKGKLLLLVIECSPSLRIDPCFAPDHGDFDINDSRADQVAHCRKDNANGKVNFNRIFVIKLA